MFLVLAYVALMAVIMIGGGYLISKQGVPAYIARVEEFALQHGLEYTPPGLAAQARLEGVYRGVHLAAYMTPPAPGSRLEQGINVIYETQLSPQAAPVDMVLFPETMLTKLKTLFGGEDVQVGIADIDATFVIRGVDAQTAREFFLRPGVREALLDLRKRDRSMRLTYGSLMLDRLGDLTNPTTIKKRMDLIADCALALEAGAAPRGEATLAPGREMALEGAAHWQLPQPGEALADEPAAQPVALPDAKPADWPAPAGAPPRDENGFW